jgi:HD-GYP domain-containing protein (c-di-GMP phosphodiesterase class II)
MFRRKAAEPAEGFDQIRAAQELLGSRTLKGLLESAIQSAMTLAPAATRGWAVIRSNGTDKIAALKGYGSEYIGVELVGPWNDGQPRISTNPTNDFFNPNLPDARAKLSSMGIREYKQCLVVPFRDRSVGIRGAMMLDSYQDQFAPSSLEALNRWGGIVASILGGFMDMSKQRSLAWNLTLTFVEAIEAQEFNQLGHAVRVTSYAMALARELGLNSLEQNDIWFTAMLHDLGRLSDSGADEVSIASLGYNLLERVSELETARLAILHAHERFDGSGGPRGLRGQAIPLFSRVVAVANAYDLLTTDRGEELNSNEAVERIKKEAGTRFDPEIITKLEAVLKQQKATREFQQGSLFPSS